jgi:hypothetical protein
MRQAALAHAIEKLARAGEQAGISVEEMIQILNGGVSVSILLDFIELSLEAHRENATRHPHWIT